MFMWQKGNENKMKGKIMLALACFLSAYLFLGYYFPYNIYAIYVILLGIMIMLIIELCIRLDKRHDNSFNMRKRLEVNMNE